MIDWIVTGSALILLVLVLRLMVRERISPRLRYALWGLGSCGTEPQGLRAEL